jgi:hypothetical protein
MVGVGDNERGGVIIGLTITGDEGNISENRLIRIAFRDTRNYN